MVTPGLVGSTVTVACNAPARSGGAYIARSCIAGAARSSTGGLPRSGAPPESPAAPLASPSCVVARWWPQAVGAIAQATKAGKKDRARVLMVCSLFSFDDFDCWLGAGGRTPAREFARRDTP